MRLLNIGCGRVAHPAWINYDLEQVSDCPHVRVHDLRTGIPEADGSIDAVYSSHVLEHLTPEEAIPFLAEQRRVLKPGGVLRIVVPDLEAICRNYCTQLDLALHGAPDFRYDYTLLELYDQTVRSTHGGQMGKLWHSGSIPDLAYVAQRHGREAMDVIEGLPHAPAPQPTFLDRVKRKSAKLAVQVCLGSAGVVAFEEGQIRQSGEIHRWMYDRFSLARLLTANGFHDPIVWPASQSQIPDFVNYDLESQNGQPRKPDSLYMEARH
jgi:predicted SAM-dependent methyltransferase